MSTSTLHVLLVDDEPLVKMALQKIIDWESHHYAICATASDGEEALRLQVELSPDIIITDLKMPGLDGIELIKRLKQAKYTGCVLIISNYDDYEYVREGLKLGAVDYLLKIALNKQSLLEQLQKCREILQNRGGDYRVPEVDHDLLIKYYLTSQDVQNEPPPALLWQSDDSFYICHCTGLHSGFINNSDKSFTFDTVKNAVLQLFSFIQKEHVLCMRGDTLLLIIPENALIESTLAIEELCGRLLRYFDSFFLLPFYVVYSGVCDQSTVRHVYKQAENASRMRFYGQERIASISAADFTRLPPSLSVKAIGSQLLEYVKHNLPDEVVSTINSIASDLVKNRTEPAEIRKFFSDLLSYCHAVISRVYPVNIQAQQDDIASASYIQEIQFRAVKFLTNLPRIVGTDPDSYKKDVLKSISYIQQHYTERITTSTIAEHVQLSGNYLSKIFKEDTGISVTQYINMLKMEKALELLESKQNYVREVAETVGIPDQFYFNRLFKKYHGKSPSNYIKG